MERKQKILEILKEGKKTPKELASIFNVSLMTIYRDIKDLESEGLIERKHGYVSLKDETSQKECIICHKEIDGRFNMIFFLKEGKKFQTCCPHCGLMAYKNFENRIEAILAKDFITCNPVNAFSGWFVVGAEIAPCCSPSAFVFGSKELAEKFAKGFGGGVFTFQDAVKEIYRLMNLGQKVEFKL